MEKQPVPPRSSLTIGRTEQLAAVRQRLDLAANGNGSATLLVGPAGIGKSRFAEIVMADARRAGMIVLRGKCSALAPSVPYRPLAEALLALQRAGRLADTTELGSYRRVLARLVPDLGPAPPEDTGSILILAEAVLRVVSIAGRNRGCLLVLEDMHDADSESLAVAEYLLDNIADQPIVLLVTARSQPSVVLDLMRSVAHRGLVEIHQLPPLTRLELTELVADIQRIAPAQVPDDLVDLVVAGSAGNPLLAEEMLTEMLDSGMFSVEDHDHYRFNPRSTSDSPSVIFRTVTARIERLVAPDRTLLHLAALLGQRFPLEVLRQAMGRTQAQLAEQLAHDDTRWLIRPDEHDPGWYGFRHQLFVDAVRAAIEPTEHARLSATLADAIDRTHPGLPGEWCQLQAALRLASGDTYRAGLLLAEAGRRAVSGGATDSAVALLERARELLADGPTEVRADLVETLLDALAEAGLVDRALESIVEGFTPELDPHRLARLYTRIAWAALLAGRLDDAGRQIDRARSLLGRRAGAAHLAPVNTVAAYLMAETADRLDSAATLAQSAAVSAERSGQPTVACQALQLLGTLQQRTDPEGAMASFTRALSLAGAHGLSVWEIYAMIRLGNDQALRENVLDWLYKARDLAVQVGAVRAQLQADVNISIHTILRGEFPEAETLLDTILSATPRLRLMELSQHGQLHRAMLAAHQGRRADMERSLKEFHRHGGNRPVFIPRIHGLIRTICALLEEDPDRARAEQSAALRAEDTTPTTLHLSGRYGLALLLRALNADLDHPTLIAMMSRPEATLPWDRQFAHLASAVLHGRAGQPTAADRDVREALRLGNTYAMARPLGLRLVAEAAITDGWGQPVRWLRQSEEYFHTAGIPAVAAACRTLLRKTGAPISQRRKGHAAVPRSLRSRGITVREYEVLRLLAGRLPNREIAARLHLSPRTVERHVASLLLKTGTPNRRALADLIATLPEATPGQPDHFPQATN